MTISTNPHSAPPMCAKWAIPVEKPPTPLKRSNKIRPPIKNLAFMGIGGNSNISLVFGNKMANAIKIPMMAPEAPTTGTAAITPRKDIRIYS